MAEFKFVCPRCAQHIQCDELWCGHQIQCPACQTQLIVPQGSSLSATAPPPPIPAPSAAPSSLVPPPPPPSAPKLTFGRPQAPAQAASPASSPPSRPGPARRPPAPTEAKGGVFKILKIAAVLVVLGVGGYFGFIWLSNMQEKMNGERKKVESRSDGGEMGHIANVYEVLDATDNTRRGPTGSGRHISAPDSSRVPLSKAVTVGSANNDPDEAAGLQRAPLIPAVWTLDLEAAKIPDGRANGLIAGSNFVVETASIQPSGTAQVLALRQGTGPNADRELMVYLHLNAGETLSSHTWTVTKDMTGSAVPKVLKRWKTDPRYAPQQKFFSAGYAMKLELGASKDGVTPGKIFLALPDTEQSVVAGAFRIGEHPMDTAER